MVEVKVTGGQISEEEKNAYIERGIELDGDYVNLHYHITPVPFQRIRRITGYLVGTLDRFNDAKRDEVESRVKHMKAN